MDFLTAIDHSARAIVRKTVSARRRKSEPDWRFTRDAHATREKLPAVAVGNSGKFFPAQAQPVVPCLTHALAGREITLIELVAFDDLCER